MRLGSGQGDDDALICDFFVQDKAKKEDDFRHLESEALQLRQYKDNGQSETEVLMSALSAMQVRL